VIQIRGVPEKLHSILKARAAREGMSLSDFIKKELAHSARAADHAGVAGEHAAGETDSNQRSAAQIIRELRDAR